MQNVKQRQRSFRLISRSLGRFRLTNTMERPPFRGVAFFPVPPNDPGQKILEMEVYAEGGRGKIEARRTTESGPLKKPILQLDLNESDRFRIVSRFDVQFFENSLVPGKPSAPPAPLSAIERAEYLKDGWQSREARAWFREWLTQNKLLRPEGQSDIDFAFDALRLMQRDFTYSLDEPDQGWKTIIKNEPELGTWRYSLGTHTGECWRLSDTYCRILRTNGIPARLLSGNIVGKRTGHHLRSLIYLEGTGWVPVEATFAVCSKNTPAEKFLGDWGETMLSGNENVDYQIEHRGRRIGIGTFDSFAFLSDMGTTDVPSIKFTSEKLGR